MQNIFHRHHGPTDLWVRCGGCHELIYRREFENNLHTCPKCSFHARINAGKRIELLLDPDTWAEEDALLAPADPLGFVSVEQTYASKLTETQLKTGLQEAIITGTGQIEGQPLRLAVLDFGFMGASMGSVVGEKLARATEHSIKDRRPLVIVNASGRARMHEGID